MHDAELGLRAPLGEGEGALGRVDPVVEDFGRLRGGIGGGGRGEEVEAQGEDLREKQRIMCKFAVLRVLYS